MRDCRQFYIDGAWIEAEGRPVIDVINPATEGVAGVVAIGTVQDVDRAVAAARTAFPSWSQTSVEERLAVLDRVIEAYQARYADLAAAVTEEMGAPAWLAEQAQAVMGLAHFQKAREILASYEFNEFMGTTSVLREPVGVCAFITPWNWPLNQIACKVAPALAVGCTMVLKPSEVAPFSASIFAQVMHDAGVPAGVFNLVHGDGPGVGTALAEHPDVDMISFTGSTQAGIAVARNAAPTVKRVHQELGGKSPHVILASADLAAAVESGVTRLMVNSGQSCNAPTRMLVPADRMADAAAIARSVAEAHVPGDPAQNARMGPVVSATQWTKIQQLIAKGIGEGATLVAGGPGKPDGLDQGYFVKPTVFADVTNDMTIAREEIFGPVLSIIGYTGVDDAVRIANDTPFGLAAYVHGAPDEARQVARRLRAGQVFLNGAMADFGAPFGGYKQSGNGREWGQHAFADFTELKAIMGDGAAA